MSRHVHAFRWEPPSRLIAAIGSNGVRRNSSPLRGLVMMDYWAGLIQVSGSSAGASNSIDAFGCVFHC
jgi:hypothetical protein